MSLIRENRQKILQDLDNFVISTNEKISSLLSTLGWSIESISKNAEKMVVCPFNQSHHVLEQSLLKHLEDCQWKAEGYGEKDLPLSTPSLPSGTPMSIKFDEQLQDDVIHEAKQKNPQILIGTCGRLIPRTSDRLISEFSRDERLSMYDYVIANTAQPDIGEDITDMNKPKASGNGKTSSYLELLAQERNLKRRRAKYRGVHTNKKSQVEILREVINQQMEMFAEYIGDKKEIISGQPEIEDKNRLLDYVKKERLEDSRKFTEDNNRGEYRPRSLMKYENTEFNRESTNNRNHDRSYYRNRDFSEENHFSREKRKHENDHSDRYSSEKKSRKSSHKSHKHRSRDRHDTDRGKSRSKHDEKRKDAVKDSKRDEKRSKRRKRSRER